MTPGAASAAPGRVPWRRPTRIAHQGQLGGLFSLIAERGPPSQGRAGAPVRACPKDLGKRFIGSPLRTRRRISHDQVRSIFVQGQADDDDDQQAVPPGRGDVGSTPWPPDNRGEDRDSSGRRAAVGIRGILLQVSLDVRRTRDEAAVILQVSAMPAGEGDGRLE